MINETVALPASPVELSTDEITEVLMWVDVCPEGFTGYVDAEMAARIAVTLRSVSELHRLIRKMRNREAITGRLAGLLLRVTRKAA